MAVFSRFLPGKYLSCAACARGYSTVKYKNSEMALLYQSLLRDLSFDTSSVGNLSLRRYPMKRQYGKSRKYVNSNLLMKGMQQLIIVHQSINLDR